MAKAATKSAPKAAKPAAPVSRIQIIDVEQGSAEWKLARCGVPTASNFSKIMAQSVEREGRAEYMRELAGERITRVPAETYRNAAMDRGNEMEARLRAQYAAETFDKVTQVGFIRNGKYGCSPDSLVGDEGGAEFKSLAPALMIKLIEAGGKPPTKHRPQVQGNLWLSERKWWDLVVGYAPDEEIGKPMPLLKWRFVRDEAYIQELHDACEVFEMELRRLVERIEATRR